MEDPIIKLNTRGQYIEVRKSVLFNMRYFRCLLGDGPFKGMDANIDGSYYVDIDRDVFRELLSYVEFGIFRTNRFNPNLLSAVMDKFGIEYQITKKETIREQKEKLRKDFQEHLLQEIRMHIVDNKITIEMVSGDKDEIKYLDDKLVVLYSYDNSKFIRNILRSESLAMEYFTKLGPILKLQLPERLNDRLLSVTFLIN